MPQRLAAVRTAVRPATAPAGGARRPAEPPRDTTRHLPITSDKITGFYRIDMFFWF